MRARPSGAAVTSAGDGRWTPNSRARLADAGRIAARRSARARRAGRARGATARPMPRLPPVTSALRPRRCHRSSGIAPSWATRGRVQAAALQEHRPSAPARREPARATRGPPGRAGRTIVPAATEAHAPAVCAHIAARRRVGPGGRRDLPAALAVTRSSTRPRRSSATGRAGRARSRSRCGCARGACSRARTWWATWICTGPAAGRAAPGDPGHGIERRARGQGHGRALIEGRSAWARDHGLAWIDLGVFAHNASARALYAKVGFVEVGTTRDQFRVDGTSIDDVAMTLRL